MSAVLIPAFAAFSRASFSGFPAPISSEYVAPADCAPAVVSAPKVPTALAAPLEAPSAVAVAPIPRVSPIWVISDGNSSITEPTMPVSNDPWPTRPEA